MSLISVILYFITGFIALINIIIVIVINYFLSCSERKKENLVRNYEWVPITYL